MSLSGNINQLFNAFLNSGAVRKITYPNLAGGITLTGGKAWAYGAWAQIVLAAAVTVDFWLSSIYVTTINTATGDEYQVQIGTGLVATPPTGIATFLVGDELKTDVGHYLHVEVPIGPFPILIPAATNIAAEVANAAAGAANTVAVKVAGYTTVGN